MKDIQIAALVITLVLGITCVFTAQVINLLADISNQLTTLQTSLDNYADERSAHYRTVEYYLHNTLTPVED